MKKYFVYDLHFQGQAESVYLAEDVEQLQATNQQLVGALEWIVSEIKDCAQPEDWESFDACEKAITNAKQVKE